MNLLQVNWRWKLVGVCVRVCVCGTAFYSVLRRNCLEICMPCEFQSFTHTAQNISHKVEHKNTMLLPSTTTTVDAIGSNTKLNVALENIEPLISYWDVKEELEAASHRQ